METIRRLGIPLGIIAAALLILLFNPWLEIDEGPLRQAMTIGFWVASSSFLAPCFGSFGSTSETINARRFESGDQASADTSAS